MITYRQPVESLLTSIGAKVAAHDMSHYAPGPQKNTPLANLWLTLLHTVGVEAQSFADSTGEVGEILPA